MLASTRPARIAKRLLYRVLHAGGSTHPVLASCGGVKLHFSSNCRIGEALYANAFERRQRGVLDKLVQPGSVVLDVGANLGFYTCLFGQRVGPKGRVIAIEPTPAVFHALQRNVELNRLGDRVACHQAALSRLPGVAKLHVFPEGEEVYNSIAARHSWSDQPSSGTINVQTKTIDSVLADVRPDTPCFIKVDVEGFQHQVLLGGEGFLQRSSSVGLMVELDDATAQQCGASAADTVRLMVGYGFQPHLEHGGRLRLIPESAFESGGVNEDVFFLKPQSFPRGLVEATA